MASELELVELLRSIPPHERHSVLADLRDIARSGESAAEERPHNNS
jgi:hypothetical protein